MALTRFVPGRRTGGRSCGFWKTKKLRRVAAQRRKKGGITLLVENGCEARQKSSIETSRESPPFVRR